MQRAGRKNCLRNFNSLGSVENDYQVGLSRNLMTAIIKIFDASMCLLGSENIARKQVIFYLKQLRVNFDYFVVSLYLPSENFM